MCPILIKLSKYCDIDAHLARMDSFRNMLESTVIFNLSLALCSIGSPAKYQPEVKPEHQNRG